MLGGSETACPKQPEKKKQTFLVRFQLEGRQASDEEIRNPNEKAPETILGVEKLNPKISRKSGQRRARTADTGLFRAVLYQLSYLTAIAETSWPKPRRKFSVRKPANRFRPRADRIV
jgi:hypothetical protein